MAPAPRAKPDCAGCPVPPTVPGALGAPIGSVNGVA
jgi:hypothetical protein